MPRVHSFAPVARRDATTLIVGSMPGVASLRAGQYYAHPQNLFWPIVGKLLAFDPTERYARRIRMLAAARIALWDVLQACEREGSLDADIDEASLQPNDFAAFFSRHRQITRVFFNGAKAEACFRRHVMPDLRIEPVEYQRLPSTSPANASISYVRKFEAWRAALRS